MSRRRLTLTFDNGPTPGVTEDVLDVLGRHGATATFFLIGEHLQRARPLAERARAEGHRIGNHTMHHRLRFGTVADEEPVRLEIEDAQALLEGLADPDRLFRPFCAAALGPHVLSPAAARHLESGRYTLVLWTSLPGDWKAPDEWVERALDDIEASDWSVVVLHDEHLAPTRHLARFLDEVAARDVEIVAELPAACTPILRGEAIGPLAHLMPPPREHAA